MTNTILQINLTYDCSQAELEAAFSHAAGAIAPFPGLTWKIWIINDEMKEAGGLYCFESEIALTNYINSPIMATLKAHPLLKNVDVKAFGAIAALTAQTRGPIPVLPTSLGA
ncbi:MAG TPA: YdhR family protein [Candidatus Obscuribacterales bacterium]